MNSTLHKLKPIILHSGLLSILTILGFILYFNSINAPFIFDDLQNIAENPYIGVSAISWENIKNIISHCHARPLPHLSFAANYYLNNYNVIGYHIVNIIIHIVNGLLLFIFTKKTIQLTINSSQDQNRIKNEFYIPFFVTLLWFVHPVHIQSVTYIVQRMNSMAAMFYILSALMYIFARETQKKFKADVIKNSLFKYKILGFFISCFVFGIFSVGCKQNAVTLPFFILSYELFFFQDIGNLRIRKFIPWIAGFLILIIGVLLVLIETNLHEKIFALYKTQDFNMAQRLLTEPRVILYYISLFFFPSPSRLMLEYNYPISHNFFEPVVTSLSIFTIVLIVLFSFYILRKERLLAFCLLWFLGALSIESSIIGLAIIFEHRTYLSFMFLSIISVSLLFRYFKKALVPIGIICIVIITYSSWTYQRNIVWESSESLYLDNLKKADHYRLHLNLGVALSSKGNLENAQSHFQDSFRLYPYCTEALFNMGNCFRTNLNYPKAIYYYQKALEKIPYDYKTKISNIEVDIYNNLGSIMFSRNEINFAKDYYEKALRIEPSHANALLNLGLCYLNLNFTDLAIHSLNLCIENSPQNINAHYYVGRLLYNQKRYRESLKHFKIAHKLNPNFKDIKYFINEFKKQVNHL